MMQQQLQLHVSCSYHFRVNNTKSPWVRSYKCRARKFYLPLMYINIYICLVNNFLLCKKREKFRCYFPKRINGKGSPGKRENGIAGLSLTRYLTLVSVKSIPGVFRHSIYKKQASGTSIRHFSEEERRLLAKVLQIHPPG